MTLTSSIDSIPKKDSKKQKKEEEKVSPIKNKSRKTPKVREGPKAATTAFFFFQAERRGGCKIDNPALSNKEIVRVSSFLFRNLLRNTKNFLRLIGTDSSLLRTPIEKDTEGRRRFTRQPISRSQFKRKRARKSSEQLLSKILVRLNEQCLPSFSISRIEERTARKRIQR